MTTLIIDKFASVTGLIPLPKAVTLTTDLPTPSEGLVLAVRVLNRKTKYNKLELTSGRISEVHQGDILAIALGSRRALLGFSGDVPQNITVGGTLDLLSLGGVTGTCLSANAEEVGAPFQLEVLGAILHEGKPAHLQDYAQITPSQSLPPTKPIVIVSGTCMNSGKTAVACQVITHARAAGLRTAGVKLTGVAALRDTLEMQDAGAITTRSFVGAACCSTVQPGHDTAAIAKGIFTDLATADVDLIVVECGDGIMGEYGVQDILKDQAIQAAIACHIGCAQDPPGAMMLSHATQGYGRQVDIISGPVTDNGVGLRFIDQQLSLPAANALKSPESLFRHCLTTLGDLVAPLHTSNA